MICNEFEKMIKKNIKPFLAYEQEVHSGLSLFLSHLKSTEVSNELITTFTHYV